MSTTLSGVDPRYEIPKRFRDQHTEFDYLRHVAQLQTVIDTDSIRHRIFKDTIRTDADGVKRYNLPESCAHRTPATDHPCNITSIDGYEQGGILCVAGATNTSMLLSYDRACAAVVMKEDIVEPDTRPTKLTHFRDAMLTTLSDMYPRKTILTGAHLGNKIPRVSAAIRNKLGDISSIATMISQGNDQRTDIPMITGLIFVPSLCTIENTHDRIFLLLKGKGFRDLDKDLAQLFNDLR